MKQRITRSVLTDERGRLLQRSVQTGPQDPPWRNLTREEDEATMARPIAWLYPRDGSPLVRLKRVEILVATTRFVADGQEECAIQVRGELEKGEAVGVSINGTRYEIDDDDIVLLRATTAGLYTVELDDDNFYTEKPAVTIMAISSNE